jgi:hypothetical protein
MVPFESLLEREAVMVFDFDPSVVEIVAQPFVLLWPCSTSHHFPDLLIRNLDGAVAVVDVRTVPLLDERATRQFELTRRALSKVGCGYSVYTGAAEPLVSNLTFLAGFRKHHVDPDPETAVALRAVFDPSARLGAGIQWAGSATGRDGRSLRTASLSMLWNHQLHTDLTADWLSDATVVTA